MVKVDGLQVELDWEAGQAEQQGNRFLTLWKAKVCNLFYLLTSLGALPEMKITVKLLHLKILSGRFTCYF